jgi:hypothetical protein
MKRLVLHSWLLLLYFDWIMRRHQFSELHRIVENEPIRPTTSARLTPFEEVSRAIDYACVLYFRRVLCLQRSSATVVLLRRLGWNAEMLIGAQVVPFKSHAWCEINGVIVNDKPYMHDIYEVLDRC